MRVSQQANSRAISIPVTQWQRLSGEAIHWFCLINRNTTGTVASGTMECRKIGAALISPVVPGNYRVVRPAIAISISNHNGPGFGATPSTPNLNAKIPPPPSPLRSTTTTLCCLCYLLSAFCSWLLRHSRAYFFEKIVFLSSLTCFLKDF